MHVYACVFVCYGSDMFMCVFLIIKEISSREVCFFQQKKKELVNHTNFPSGKNCCGGKQVQLKSAMCLLLCCIYALDKNV